MSEKTAQILLITLNLFILVVMLGVMVFVVVNTKEDKSTVGIAAALGLASGLVVKWVDHYLKKKAGLV